MTLAVIILIAVADIVVHLVVTLLVGLWLNRKAQEAVAEAAARLAPVIVSTMRGYNISGHTPKEEVHAG